MLSVDADILPLKPRSEMETYSMTHTLQSLIDIINDFPTHPYMPVIKVERALQLSVGLKMEGGDTAGKGLCYLHQILFIIPYLWKFRKISIWCPFEFSGDEVCEFIQSSIGTAAVSVVIFLQQRLAGGWKQVGLSLLPLQILTMLLNFTIMVLKLLLQMNDLPSLKLCCEALQLIVCRPHDSHVREAIEKLSARCFHFLNTLNQVSQKWGILFQWNVEDIFTIDFVRYSTYVYHAYSSLYL